MLCESEVNVEEYESASVVVPISTMDTPTMSYTVANTAPFQNITVSWLASLMLLNLFLHSLPSFENTFLAATSPWMPTMHMISSSRSSFHPPLTNISVNSRFTQTTSGWCQLSRAEGGRQFDTAFVGEDIKEYQALGGMFTSIHCLYMC